MKTQELELARETAYREYLTANDNFKAMERLDKNGNAATAHKNPRAAKSAFIRLKKSWHAYIKADNAFAGVISGTSNQP